MSGAQAAAASGCCCRPLIGCPCDNPNRPGAIFDASLSSVLVSMDVSVNHSFYDDRTTYPACPGQGCACTGLVFAWPYAYQHQGRGYKQDEACFCAKNDCPGCYPFHLNATASSAILRNIPQSFGGPRFRTVSVSALDHVIGTWSWQPYQAAYCIGNDGIRVRRYCRFPYIDVAGGITTSVVVDPNGQYVNDVTGEYTMGLHGSNIGSMCALLDITISYQGWLCGYEARVAVVYRSLAGILDVINGGYLTDDLLPRYIWHYQKPCLSPSDTVLGTYVRVEPADIESYDTDQDCGPSHYFDDLRATAGDTLTVS